VGQLHEQGPGPAEQQGPLAVDAADDGVGREQPGPGRQKTSGRTSTGAVSAEQGAPRGSEPVASREPPPAGLARRTTQHFPLRERTATVADAASTATLTWAGWVLGPRV
jgi:hypothetical protein